MFEVSKIPLMAKNDTAKHTDAPKAHDWAGAAEERLEELSGIQSILDPETKTMTLSSIRHFVL